MKYISRRLFVASALSLGACSTFGMKGQQAGGPPETFICPPCGCSMDHVIFDAPGRCPACEMVLRPSIDVDLGFEPETLAPRAGRFTIAGGAGREEKLINVHYYLPDGFQPDWPILLIIPGSGRNSDDYRNAWLASAKRKNIIIAALGYPEDEYDFATYQMGGVVTNLQFDNPQIISTGPNSIVYRLDDKDIHMDINPNRTDWLFQDFDRAFSLIASASGSTRTRYDIFGHSAGGQILHRLALFHPESLAERIIAANAGFYTLPDLNTSPPTGVAGTGLTESSITATLSQPLTLLLGENDNSDDAGGILLHTPVVDAQGLGRLERGRNFFQRGQNQASAMGVTFNWNLRTVPGVGHDFAAMGDAATEFLYPER